jgi:hypothetical protein
MHFEAGVALHLVRTMQANLYIFTDNRMFACICIKGGTRIRVQIEGLSGRID